MERCRKLLPEVSKPAPRRRPYARPGLRCHGPLVSLVQQGNVAPAPDPMTGASGPGT